MLLLIVYCLAVWRLTNLLYAESGPFDLFEYIRNFLCRCHPVLAKGLQCPLCVSVWMAVPMGIVYLLGWHILAYVLAWSGATCLIYICLEVCHKAAGIMGQKYNQESFK